MVRRHRMAGDIVHRSILFAVAAVAAAAALASCGEFVPLGVEPGAEYEEPIRRPQGGACLFFDNGEPTRCRPPASRCTGPCCGGCSSKCEYKECDLNGKCENVEGVCASTGDCIGKDEPTFCPDDNLR